MDKRTLVQIIVKDLEELKILSEEVADSQDNSSLVIDLALNKARLLIQEIELLRELAGNSEALCEEPEEEIFDEDEDEVSNISFPDPELEILNFEEGEFPESEEFINEEVPEDEDKEDEEDNDENEEDDLDEEDMEDDSEPEPEDDLTVDLEDDDLAVEEDDSIDDEDNDEDELDEGTEIEEEEELPQEKPTIQVTELKTESHSGIREINIDDPDDDFEIEHAQFSSSAGSTARPPMREIPKPENPVVGESFQKERSLNDSIGENKSMDSKLTNSPITNLRAAIGLNDRFIFIREIFDNNTEKYNTVIERLDKMESIQQAVEYLKANLSMQKNEASLKFVDLLKRRFTK